MSGCVLSPYGTYDTSGVCNESEECGYGWKCSAAGVPVLAPGGTKASAEDCLCWECTETGCVTNDAGDGSYRERADCDTVCTDKIDSYTCSPTGPVKVFGGEIDNADDCKYTCEDGSPRVATAGEEQDIFQNVKCGSCLGTNKVALTTTTGRLGDIDNGAECTYTCEPSGASSTKTFQLGGTPLDQLNCYNCDPGAVNPDVAAPMSGTVGGNHPDISACTYTCDGQGGKLYRPGENAYSEFECYNCDGNPAYVPVPEGQTGSFAGQGSCEYWCVDRQKVAVTDQERTQDLTGRTVDNITDVKCWRCEGDAGPDSWCGKVPDRSQGVYESLEECDANPTAQCGWGYGCENDECGISSLAPRERSEEECKMDSTDKCGWGYGCYTKFACLDGVACAGVPDAECDTLTCYDSADACVASSACSATVVSCENPFAGEWRIHRSDEYTPIYDGNALFSFTPGQNDGYQWYSSTVSASGEPVIQIGIRDTIEGSQRVVRAKFKGLNNGASFWSMNGDGDRGSLAAPVSIVIAEFPAENTDCFMMDSIDLGSVCEFSNRCISMDSGYIATMILQRAELCGPSRMVGKGDSTNFGSLAGLACPCFPLAGAAVEIEIPGGVYAFEPGALTVARAGSTADAGVWWKTPLVEGERAFNILVKQFNNRVQFTINTGIVSGTLVMDSTGNATYAGGTLNATITGTEVTAAAVCLNNVDTAVSDDNQYRITFL